MCVVSGKEEMRRERLRPRSGLKAETSIWSTIAATIIELNSKHMNVVNVKASY